jgi:hypothetical protein
MEISKEQVLELKKLGNWGTSDKLKEWFPEAFKVELEVGKVYKASGCIFYYQEANKSYGFSDGEWSKPSQWVVCEVRVKDPSWVISEATTEEWESALIEEAKKRGLYDAQYFKHANNLTLNWGYPSFLESISENQIWTKNGCIYSQGVWAEIIKTFSKEEAEKLLGGKII